MKYYTVEWLDLGMLNQVFFDNIKTQNCFKKEKYSTETF